MIQKKRRHKVCKKKKTQSGYREMKTLLSYIYDTLYVCVCVLGGGGLVSRHFDINCTKPPDPTWLFSR